MTLQLAKRKSDLRETHEVEEDTTHKEEEKTIPFLRRLADMLQENDEVISFQAGSRNETSLGRIVVHDRAKVESEVLPRYFNHASFASLRRQLNYFSFTRIGKGRQRGATYTNEAVYELNDILRLKRRSVGKTTLPVQEDEPVSYSNYRFRDSINDCNQGPTKRSATIINSIVPVVHLPPPLKRSRPDGYRHFSKTKKSLKYTPIISPLSASPVHITSDDDEQPKPRIVLDLTLPLNHTGKYVNRVIHSGSSTYSSATSADGGPGGANDEDILAGCNVLLSFSSGASSPLAGKI